VIDPDRGDVTTGVLSFFFPSLSLSLFFSFFSSLQTGRKDRRGQMDSAVHASLHVRVGWRNSAGQMYVPSEQLLERDSNSSIHKLSQHCGEMRATDG